MNRALAWACLSRRLSDVACDWPSDIRSLLSQRHTASWRAQTLVDLVARRVIEKTSKSSPNREFACRKSEPRLWHARQRGCFPRLRSLVAALAVRALRVVARSIYAEI